MQTMYPSEGPERAWTESLQKAHQLLTPTQFGSTIQAMQFFVSIFFLVSSEHMVFRQG